MNGELPIVEEVLRFEDLPLGALASRRAIVRWSDGTKREQIRALHFPPRPRLASVVRIAASG